MTLQGSVSDTNVIESGGGGVIDGALAISIRGCSREWKKKRGFSSKQNTLFNTFITVLHHRTTSSVGHNNWMGVLVVIWVRVSYCEWCEERTMMHCHILLQHFKRWNFGGSPFSVGVTVGWAWVESKVVKIRGRVPLWGTKSTFCDLRNSPNLLNMAPL